MTRDELIEAMARVLCASFYGSDWDATSDFRQGICRTMARAAMIRIEEARPDIAAVLRGEAVVVPREASARMASEIESAAKQKFGKAYDDDAAAELYAAMIAAGEKEMGE